MFKPKTLLELATEACIPLECGQLISQEIKRPTKVYTSFLCFGNEYSDIQRMWSGEISSSPEFSQKTIENAKTFEEIKAMGIKYTIEVAEYFVFDFKKDQPIFWVGSTGNVGPPIIAQHGDYLDNQIALQKLWNNGKLPVIYKGFVDGGVMKKE